MIILKVFVILCVGLSEAKVLKMLNNVTNNEYDRMPIVFHIDDFDKCLRLETKTLYCAATIQLSPTNFAEPSEVWRIIEEVISLPRNYRHDRLRHSICIPESCPDITEQFYEVGNGTEELWEGIGKCYSDKYKNHQLNARVIKLHCENETAFYEIDYVDQIYAIIVLSLIAVVIFSTCLEGYAKLCNPDKYQQITEASKFDRITTCFSVLRNWERLTAEITGPDGLALAPIQGVRVFNMYFVILAHTGLLSYVTPGINPKWGEEVTLQPLNIMVLNGGLICDTNMIIANFLATYYILVNSEGAGLKFRDLIDFFCKRLIRIVPIILLVVGFNATWLRHISRGPIWEMLVGSEFKNCRKNWLLNIFFLNNYINPDEMCLEQSWYIAADMQGLIVSLCILMYISKRPKHANKLFSLVILLATLITFIQHYAYGYEIIFRTWPEDLHSLLLNNIEFLKFYIPGHHHITSCVLGVMCGFNFYIYKTKNWKFIEDKILGFLLVIYFLVAVVGTILSAILFHLEGYEQTRFGAALYQSVFKLSFGMPIAILLFAFSMGNGGIIRIICNWTPFHYLGRLSLCAYLGHSIPMIIKAGVTRSLIFSSYFTTFSNNLSDLFFAYVFATIMCICFEMPISALIQLCQSRKKEKSN